MTSKKLMGREAERGLDLSHLTLADLV